MADLTITEANMKRFSGRLLPQACGEAIHLGDVVCVNPSDKNNIYQAGANEAVDLFRLKVVGIALGKTLASGQSLSYLGTNGDVVDFGAGVLERGMWYALSPNRAKICPITDYQILAVATTQITSNVATFTTLIPHAFVTGQKVTTLNCGAIYNSTGTGWVVASTPTATTFTVAITHANDGPNSVTGTAQLKGVIQDLIGIAQDTEFMRLVLSSTGIVR